GGGGCARLPEDILRDADTAMYRAKAGGKGGYAFFDASMRREADRRLLLATHLRQAVPRGEVRLVYQPLACPATGGLAGFEALARWRHPRLGSISPTEFIPVAEQTNLIAEIGRFVLSGAAATLRRWLDRFPGKGIFVSVNVSGCQFRHGDLAAEVEEALFRERLPAGALKLEITESVLMERPDAAARTLSRLKALGAGVLIDDFGTGYSSLAVLRRLPAEAVKIDRSFVRGMEDGRGRELMRLMVEMAHALGMAVVVEGVERRDEAERLAGMGCDMIQGHYFGRAVEEEAACGMLAGDAAP
ncbi:MAG: putative bifunctional diguanylate cyclase/phosphodiesterase, partial [Thermodesulfobacteriota bacterium]